MITAPFPFDQYEAADASENLKRVGLEVYGHSPNGDGAVARFRLVRLNATTTQNPRGVTFKYTDPTLFTVEPVDGVTDKPCGVGHPSLNETLAVSVYFWVQFDGHAEVRRGDDGTAIVAGDQCGPDDDATPKGSVKKNDTDDQDVTVFRAIDAAAGVDTIFTAQILKPLVG